MKTLKRMSLAPFLLLLSLTLFWGCGEEDGLEPDADENGCSVDDLDCARDEPPIVRPVCTPSASGAPINGEAVLARGDFEVGLIRGIEWTRDAKCYEEGENRDCARKLIVDLRYPAERGPDDELAPIEDPAPLLIYSHGFMSSRAENPKLLELLASRGIASIAVQYPRTALGSVAEIGDVVNQPGDVSALIDWALGEIEHEESQALLPEGIEFDASKLLVGGVSLGGMTSLLAAFHRELGDDRIALGFGLAPPASMFLDSFYEERSSLPFMLVAATSDAIVPYALSGEAAFARMSEHAAFISIEGGTHIGVTEQGALFARQPHPDGPACGLLGLDAEPGSDDAPSDDPLEGGLGRYGELGGEDEGIDPNAPLGNACSLSGLPPAIAPGQQLAIVQLAVVSFIESRLNGDADYEAYLREGLEAETCWARYTPPAAD